MYYSLYVESGLSCGVASSGDSAQYPLGQSTCGLDFGLIYYFGLWVIYGGLPLLSISLTQHNVTAFATPVEMVEVLSVPKV